VPLPDFEIYDLCERHAMVVPFDPELVNPASIDVLLGDRLMVEVEDRPELQILGISHHTQADPYWLAPGEFCLAETREIFNLPDFIAAQFVLKSSRAREGLEHLLAGFCDPGWHGSRLTMELSNARRFHSIAIWPGMKIGQMVFQEMDGIPTRSYSQTGRYCNDLMVTASKG
jgi:dCTP deaminase